MNAGTCHCGDTTKSKSLAAFVDGVARGGSPPDTEDDIAILSLNVLVILGLLILIMTIVVNTIDVLIAGCSTSIVSDVVVVCIVTGVGISLPDGLHNSSKDKLMTFFVHMSFVVMVNVSGGAK